MSELIEIYPKLGEAYRLKELFRDFWQFHNKEEAMAFLAYRCDLTEETQIPALKSLSELSKAIGLELSTMSSQKSLTVFLKASTIKFSWQKEEREDIAILIILSI